MNIQEINNFTKEIFINNFQNIFEKTSSIAIFVEKNRPFSNKQQLIDSFVHHFESLSLDNKKSKYSLSVVISKTLGFTYLNPHVYSDTVFFLGNFSKDFLLNQKIIFGIGASISSFIFFFILGYMSKFSSVYFKTARV